MVTSLNTRELTNNFYFEQHTCGQRNNRHTAIPLPNSLCFNSLNSRSMQFFRSLVVRVTAKETSFLFGRMARRRRCKKTQQTHLRTGENRQKQTENQMGLNNYKIACLKFLKRCFFSSYAHNQTAHKLH